MKSSRSLEIESFLELERNTFIKQQQLRLKISQNYGYDQKTLRSFVTKHSFCYRNSVQQNQGISRTFIMIMALISSSLVSFPELYIADSLAAQQDYVQTVLDISLSQLGMLSSVIFLPSLFMPLICLPIIDKFGPILAGFYMNLFVLIITIPMGIFSQNYIGIIITRILAGIFQETTFLIQSSIIMKYIQPNKIAISFGIVSSVTALASLISFVFVPIIMSEQDYQHNQSQYIQKYCLTFWLNFYITLICISFYVLSSIFLIRDEKKLKEDHKQLKIQYYPDNSLTADSFLCSDNDNSVISKQNQILAVIKQLQYDTLQPNNINNRFKIQKYFNLPLDFWIINFSYCLLISVCYGSQTIILSYITLHGGLDLASQTGITISVSAMLGGPIFSVLIYFCGRRPLFQVILSLIGIISFGFLFFSPQMSPHISIFIIGILDGGASVVGRSLITNVIKQQQFDTGYAISGIFQSVGQFALPPVSGLFTMNWPNDQSGSIWFWIFMLFIGLVLSVITLIRDIKFFNKKLSK
ncbi:Major facilitator superfamily protein [Spironucleus salmonicida]|nr:Major facilitator superfamily protein [Spironucleus salmonicida]